MSTSASAAHRLMRSSAGAAAGAARYAAAAVAAPPDPPSASPLAPPPSPPFPIVRAGRLRYVERRRTAVAAASTALSPAPPGPRRPTRRPRRPRRRRRRRPRPRPRRCGAPARRRRAPPPSPPPSPPSAPPPPSNPPPLPGVPPIQNDKFSKLIFHDLVPELDRLRGETGTAFIPHSVKIDRAGFYRFLDEPYIEAIHFSNKSCALINDPFLASFTTTNTSRSEVSFFVDGDKPDCALPAPGKAVTFLNLNEGCAQSVVAGEVVLGLTFEPRCMVVTIAPNSRKDLFDQLLAAGRALDDPLQVY